jgi:large subunit ribosomal protein L29
MRADEIRELGAEDIAQRIRDLEEERFRLKFRSATEPLEDPLRLRVIRRDLARLKTIQHERATGIVRAAGPADEAKQGKGKSTARRPARKGAKQTKAR